MRYLLAAVASVALFAAAQPSVKVEFRRAEWKPAAGFSETRIPGSDKTVYVRDQADLTNADVASAKTALSENGKNYVIEVTMTDEGAGKLAKLSRDHLQKPLAILVDDKLLAAPRIASQISRKVVITGNFDRAEADRIALGILGKPAR